jgi:hypothetical protein
MRFIAQCLTVAAGLLAVLATAGSALAHDHDDWKHGRHHHGPRFVPPGHTYYVERYVERPIVYAPPPRVIYPAPMYYGPPPPPSININIPLR